METLQQFSLEDETWKNEVFPGCYVLCFLPESKGTLYGRVKPTPEGFQGQGLVVLDLYAKGVPCRTVLVPLQHVEMPLSQEQFDLAASLGWPNSEQGLTRIFNVKAN